MNRKHGRFPRGALALLLAALMALQFFPVPARAYGWDGSGSADTPYRIKNASDLVELSNEVRGGTSFEGRHFLLDADISLSGKGFQPIGSSSNPFNGNFNGNGYKITGLQLECGDAVGLFAVIGSTGSVSFLTVNGDLSSGTDTTNASVPVGGVAAVNRGRIENCEFFGSVLGMATTGGIVGDNYGTVSQCINHGEITEYAYGKKTSADGWTGGIAGESHENAKLTNCTNNGAIYGLYCYGGIVGVSKGTLSECINTGAVVWQDNQLSPLDYSGGGIAGEAVSVEDCTNSGAVNACGRSGGIVGTVFGNGHVKNCLNSGKVDCSGHSSVGGIAGYAMNHATIENCTNAASGTVLAHYRCGGIVGDCLTYCTVANCINLADLPIEPVAEIHDVLGGVGGVVGCLSYNGTISDCLNSGKISVSAVSSKGGILGCAISVLIENCLNDGDVVMLGKQSSVAGHTGGILGCAAVDYKYDIVITDCTNAGSIQGNNDSGTGGIVGSMSVDIAIHVIKNCVNTGNVSGKISCGGISGQFGLISICRNEGTVTGNEEVGGIAGQLSENGSVSDCINTGTVITQFRRGGGITGYDYLAPISGCVNTGKVIGGHEVAGIAGISRGKPNGKQDEEEKWDVGTTQIRQCRSDGKVTASGDTGVGGIIGYSYNPIKLEQCGNTGTIITDSERAGGIIGGNGASLTITDCYNRGVVYGYEKVGGIVGRTESKVTIQSTYCKAPEKGTVSGKSGIDCEAVDKPFNNYYARRGGLLGADASSELVMKHNYWWTGCARFAIGGLFEYEGFWHSGSDYDFYSYESRFENKQKFDGWDFDTVWYIDSKAKAPSLRWEKNFSGQVFGCMFHTTGGKGCQNAAVGNTGESSVFFIDSLDDFKDFRDAVNAGYDFNGKKIYLRTDIDLNYEMWEPIGLLRGGAATPFKGDFYGVGHVISRLKVNNNDHGGLFGYIVGGGVHDLLVSGLVTSSGIRVGGIVGATNGTVENCMFEGSVTCTSDSEVSLAGGIAGSFGFNSGEGCAIINCASWADVKATSGHAGGIVGELFTPWYVENCIYSGEVSAGAGKKAGGIVGFVDDVTCVVNCYAAGDGAGGLAGCASGYSGKLSTYEELEKAETYSGWDLNSDFGHIWGMGEYCPVLQCHGTYAMLVPNGADNITDPVNVWFPRSEGIYLTILPFTRTAYDFKEWNTVASGIGGMSYYSNYSVPDDTVLFAQWSPIQYTLSFQSGGNEGDYNVNYTTESGYELLTPTRNDEDYAFGGWEVTTADGNWTASEKLPADTSANGRYGNATLSGIWLPRYTPPAGVTFNALGADRGVLKNVNTDNEYSLDGGTTWKEIVDFQLTFDENSNQLCLIDSGVTAEDNILVRKTASATNAESLPYEIDVTQAAAPTGLKTTFCTTPDNNDGTITGLSSGAKYEYRRADDDDYTEIADGATSLTGLADGEYHIRVAAAGTMLASADAVVTVKGYAKAATLVISPAAGSYIGSRSVTITCETAGATIYYTTDGSDPTTASTKYTGAFTVSANTTVKAIAVKKDTVNSDVASAKYTIVPATYTLGVTAPSFDAVKLGYAQPDAEAITITSTGNSAATISSVTLSGANADAFTLTNGTAAVAAGGTNQTWTLRPKAELAENDYTATITVTYDGGAKATADVSFKVSALEPVKTPKLSPASGEHIGSVDVTITCATAEATIYYTTNGKKPTTASTKYTGSITLDSSATVKAIAVKDGMADSAIASAKYTVVPATYTLEVAAPTFDAVKLGYVQPDAEAITITSTGNSAATISSVTLSGANADSFTLTNGTAAVAAGGTNQTWAVRPKSGLAVGTYTATITVTYDGGAVAKADVSFTVSALEPVKTPVISPAAASCYTGSVEVKITCATAGAVIYYTTDGSKPTTASTKYSGAFTLDASATVRAIAVKGGMANSAVASAKYTVDPISQTNYPVTVNGGTGGGSFTAGTCVTVTANAPAVGERFKEWTGTDGLSITAGSAKSAVMTFMMPEKAVVLTATYEAIPASELIVAAPAFSVVSEGYEQPNALALVLTNTGNGVATVTSVALSGTDADAFTLNKTDGASIAAGASDGESYTIRPNAGLVAGVYIVKVTVTYDGGSVATTDVVFSVAVAKPVISHDGGSEDVVPAGTVVTITCSTLDAVIHYTIDGSEPTAESPVYEGPFTLEVDAKIKAYAIKPGAVDSLIAGADYSVTYAVIVIYGTGSGRYTEGDTVTITAGTAPAGMVFDSWSSGDVVVIGGETGTFIMPAQNVLVVARYRSTIPYTEPNTPAVYDRFSESCPPIIAKTSHGTVTVDSKAPSRGDRVTITATPDEGYRLDSLTVTDRFGKEVTLWDQGNGKWRFSQPLGSVTITAVFVPVR